MHSQIVHYRVLACISLSTLLLTQALGQAPAQGTPLVAPRQSIAVTAVTYSFPADLPILGTVTLSSTTPVSVPIQLGGFSGLVSEGLTAQGEYKFLTLTTRGPTAAPGDFVTATAGIERPFLLPEFEPQWVRFTLNPATGQITLTERISLTRNGTPLTGLPNLPDGTDGLANDDENPIDLWGNAITPDAFGINAGGMALAPDGTYWLADEYRPSLYHFAADGALLDRYVPLGSSAVISTGVETLPAVYAQRRVERGFAGVAYANGKIYACLQSALDNPDVSGDDNSRASRNVRIVELDPATGTVTGEYVYVLDDKENQIGDAIAIGPYEMLVLEHRAYADPDESVNRISLVGATNLLQYTNPTTYTVEQMGVGANPTLAQAGIVPVRKVRLVDLDATAGYPTGAARYDKPEGLAVVDTDTLAIIFDNDFSLSPDQPALNGTAPVISPTVAPTLLWLDFPVPFISGGTGEIRGTVTQAITGQIIANAMVTAGGQSSLTDANGHYVLTHLVPGLYTVSASKYGHVSQTTATAVAIGVIGNAPDIFLTETSNAARDACFLTKLDNKEPATDSASAATALATGCKTDDGNIAWKSGDPAGGQLTTLAETLRALNDFAIGAGSTVPFNHATPASFVSHNVYRGNYSTIADEIISVTRPEFAVGGGYDSTYFPLTSPAYISLTTGQTAYTHVVTRQPGVDGGVALIAASNTVSLANGDKLFGLSGDTTGKFDQHVVISSTGVPSITRGSIENPTLAQVTTAALNVLSQDPDGFFVLLEQGDIDWSNHANDFENMIGGVWDLDAAVRTAENYVDRPGGPEWSDTLIVVTADHSNSYLRLVQPLGKGQLPRQIWVDANNNGRVDDGEWTYPNGEVTYRAINHTNELVTLWARGQGAALLNSYAGQWYPGTQIVDNTQIYATLLAAAAQGAQHIILFVGDGMNVRAEVAASRYLYGTDFGLAWHDWGQLSDGWAGYASTWDVTTYNKYATAQNKPLYVIPATPATLGANDATVGYNPGGTVVPGINLRLDPVGISYLPLISR